MGAIGGFVQGIKGKTGAVGGFSMMGLAAAPVDFYMTYSMRQEENPNESKAVSALAGAGTAAGWLFAEPLMWGITLGQAAAFGGNIWAEDMKQNRDKVRNLQAMGRKDATGSPGGVLGGNFIDSQQAYTMRQKQMDLLRQHRMQTESILSSEARQLHR